MRPKKVLTQLQNNIQAYSPFWHEWIESADCTLTSEDIYIIEVQSKNNFKITLVESFMFFNQRKRIEILNNKLEVDYKLFIEWLVKEFLFSLIKISRLKDGNHYKAIWELQLNPSLIQSLLKFHTATIQQIFMQYQEDDLYKQATIAKIRMTLAEIKKSKVLTPKPLCL